MRRLNQALDKLAHRREPMGAELLIAHIERHLAGEPDVVVAQQERRGAMVTTKERPTHSPTPPRRRATAIAFASFVAIALAVLSVWLVASGEDGQDAAAAGVEPGVGLEKVGQYAASLGADDLSGLFVTDPVFGGSQYAPDFEGWLIGLNIAPELSGCLETPTEDWVDVTCVLSFGDEFFFTRVAGYPLTTRLEMRVLSDGTLQGVSMEPPGLLVSIESSMRNWVRESYPDLEDRMFGPNVALMTREAGELHMQLLDEYLASR
jgi:hypothetical protein